MIMFVKIVFLKFIMHHAYIIIDVHKEKFSFLISYTMSINKDGHLFI